MVKDVTVSGAAEGERSSTGAAPEVKRWSANRKKEVVLRLLRGESVDALSRELGIEIYRLEEWHQKALQGVESALKAREEIHSLLNSMRPSSASARSPWRTSCSGRKRGAPTLWPRGDRRNERCDLPCHW